MDDKSDSLSSFASFLAAVARTPRLPRLVPGSAIGGRYQIEGVVGAGGMGVVYRARDVQLHRDVAIKVCARVAKEEANRLLGEAIAMARLQHPNVITVYDVGQVDDDLYLAMELVAGSTMRAWLEAAPRSWRDVVRVYLEAAAGLCAVHSEGLVHGDFKPENVLIGADGRVRIVDFGLARFGEPVGDGLNGAGGTWRYMAPEHRAGEFPSQRSDQYSFCVALAEGILACGRRPRGVLRLLGRGLREDPHRRYPTLDALRRRLAERVAVRRRGLVTGAAALVLAALGAAGVWIAGRAERISEDEAERRRAALAFDVEQGRRESLAGDARRALAYLAHALEGGVDTPGVRFLVARALSSLEESFVPMPGDGGAVTAVLFAGAGSRALIGTRDGRVRLHDVADGKLQQSFIGHRGAIHSLVLDADERRLVVTASDDGTAKLWDMRTEKLVVDLVGHAGPVTGARFGDNSRQVITWSRDGTARVWDAVSGGELVRLAHDAPVTAAFIRAGVAYTAGEDGIARAWNARTGAPLRAFRGHTRPLTAIDLDPSGRTLATSSTDGTARVWNARTGEVTAVLAHDDRVTDVRFLGDRVLTASDDGIARLWSLPGGAPVIPLTGHTSRLTAVAVSADGARIVTASEDSFIRVWDTATGRPIATLGGHEQPVLAVSVTADGTRVLSGSDDGTARAWEVRPEQFLGSLSAGDERFRAAWFAGSDKVVATRDDGAVAVFRAQTGGWQPVGQPLPAAPSDRVAVSRDGISYAVAADGVVDVWNLDSRLRVLQLSTPGEIVGLTFSDDGSALLAFGDGAWVWNTTVGAERMVLPPAGAKAVAGAMTRGGERVALAHDDGTLTVWEDGRRLADPPRPAGVVLSLAYDPTGRWLALGGRDTFVHVQDARTGQPEGKLGRHAAPVYFVRFSPDAEILYSLGSDRTVKAWDLATSTELSMLPVDAFGGLDVSPDGARLLVRQNLGRVGFWDVSRDVRPAAAIAALARCLSPFGVDEAGRLVPRELARCP